MKLYRRVQWKDRMDVDGEALVLRENGFIRVRGLGPILLDILAEPHTIADLTTAVLAEIGTPSQGDPEELIATAVKSLVEAKLVVVEGPLRVLMVCTANISRSPYAEAVGRSRSRDLETLVSFTSAGTHATPGRPMDPAMVAQLAARGFSVPDHTSRPVTALALENADLVLTMEHDHRNFLLEEYPTAARKIFVLGQFAERATDADVNGTDLIEYVAHNRGAVKPTEEVPDPYGRGERAARAAADQIEQYVEVVVRALAGLPAVTPG